MSDTKMALINTTDLITTTKTKNQLRMIGSTREKTMNRISEGGSSKALQMTQDG